MTPARTFVGPTHRFDASLSLPGDKSLSHRALILAAMAHGDSHLAGLGTGADVASTIRCLRAFGVVVADDGALRSPGIHDWTQPGATLDAGNSGTTLRMLTGAVSGRPFTTTLSGDTSLRLRPMRRLVDPLRALGATVDVSTEGTAPVTVHGTAPRRCGGVDPCRQRPGSHRIRPGSAAGRWREPPRLAPRLSESHGTLAHDPRPRQGNRPRRIPRAARFGARTRSDHSGRPVLRSVPVDGGSADRIAGHDPPAFR